MLSFLLQTHVLMAQIDMMSSPLHTRERFQSHDGHVTSSTRGG